MDRKDLKKILMDHRRWLSNDGEGSSANLRSADLRSADLSYADLSSADLRSANLRSANLSYANLSYANLSSADLSSANLSSADLSSANLPSVAHLLSCSWYYVSDDICVALMRYDAWNHSNGIEAFDSWADGGQCPYNDEKFQRAANFNESKVLWRKHGFDVPPSAYDILMQLFDDKGIKR